MVRFNENTFHTLSGCFHLGIDCLDLSEETISCQHERNDAFTVARTLLFPSACDWRSRGDITDLHVNLFYNHTKSHSYRSMNNHRAEPEKETNDHIQYVMIDKGF